MTTTSDDLTITQYDVITLIEMATRRCGRLGGNLSAEEIIDCQSELSMLLNSFVNDGTPLWTLDKQIYGLNLNQNILEFSSDTIDLTNVLYRFNNLPSGGVAAATTGNAANAFDQSLNTACTQSAPNGNISYDFLTSTVVVTVGMLMNSTRTLNPTYEYSVDGITWETAIAAPGVSTYTKGQWYWLDISYPQAGRYFRVRETGGGILDAIELVFSTSANEIVLSRINRDDYQNLPFKNQTGRPLQFWFDRQISPRAWFWPASMYSFNSIVVWRRRIIQNVGTFTNSLEFPNRWLDWVIYALACRLIYILPGADLTRAPGLELKLQMAKTAAWDEERDNSEFSITPMIGGYTRST